MSDGVPEPPLGWPGGLSALGLDLTDERVYRYVLSTHCATVRDIARSVRLTQPAVERSLERMIELGMLRATSSEIPAYVAGEGVGPSGLVEQVYVPEPPNRTLGRLFQNQAAGLIRAGVAVEQMAQLYLTSREREPGDHPPLRVVQGTDSVNEAIHDLITATGSQLLLLDRHPYVRDSEPRHLGDAIFDLLARGVELRTIYAADAYRVEGYAVYMSQASQFGQQARVAENIPLRYLVSDGNCAVLPLTAEGPWLSSALFLYDTLFVADLVRCFEEFWNRATPLEGDDATDESETFTAEEVTLLVMLSSELTEAAIGRQLGTSARTIGRRLAILQHKLGTHTRFGMGAEAARRGLL